LKVVGGDPIFRKKIEAHFSQIADLGKYTPITLVLDYLPRRILDSIEGEKVLLRFEGPSTSPRSHTVRYANRFSKVLDVGTSSDLPWPIDIYQPLKSEEKKRRQTAIMVLGDKLSFSKSEMYSLRRKVAFLDPCNLEVFGTGWQAPFQVRLLIFIKTLLIQSLTFDIKLSAYKLWFKRRPKRFQMVVDKFEVMSGHTVSLVVENDHSKVTEKLFDALQSGTRVVYVGPELPDMPREIASRISIVESSADAICKALRIETQCSYVPPTELEERVLNEYIMRSWPTLLESVQLSVEELL